MKYDLILFDADGTLFDFEQAERNAFQKTMHTFNIAEDMDLLHAEYEKINKAIWLEFQNKEITSVKLRTERFRRFFNKTQLNLDPKIISPLYLKRLSEGVDLLPQAVEIVKFVSTRCEIALATNGLTDVQRPRFAASRLASYFKHIFISEEIGNPKPDREFFDFIFAKLPYRKNALIVGDNLSSDIKGGNDFDIDTCWFNPNKCMNDSEINPTYEINELEELKEIID